MEYPALLKAWSLCSLRKETASWRPPPYPHAGHRLVCFEEEALLDMHWFSGLIWLLPQKITHLPFPRLEALSFGCGLLLGDPLDTGDTGLSEQQS